MNSDEYQSARKQQAIRRKFEARTLLDQLKAGACKDCNNKFHPCQMDLVLPAGGGCHMTTLLGKSKKRIVIEAERRDLVCANCNRLRIWEKQRMKRRGET